MKKKKESKGRIFVFYLILLGFYRFFGGFNFAPGAIRTRGLLIRNQALYPTELQAQKLNSYNLRVKSSEFAFPHLLFTVNLDNSSLLSRINEPPFYFFYEYRIWRGFPQPYSNLHPGERICVMKKKDNPSDSIFIIHISLRDSDPLIWRRVAIPSDMTLNDLHEVVQSVMDWEEYHLWFLKKIKCIISIQI